MAEIAGLMVRLEATTALLRNELRRAESAVDQTAGRIEKEAGRAEGALSNIGTALKGSLAGLAGALSVDAISHVVSETLSFATRLKNVAAASGLSTQALQQLNGAFQQLGLGTDGFDNALEEMLPNLGEALTGSGGAADAFRRLGVQLRDANGNVRSTDQILLSMADAMKDIQSPAERAGIASAIFGEEAGPKMAQALSQGGSAIRALMGDVVTLSDEMINRAAEIEVAWQRMGSTVGTYLKEGILEAIFSTVNEGKHIFEILKGLYEKGRAAVTAPENAGLTDLQIQLKTLEDDLAGVEKDRAEGNSAFFGTEGLDARIKGLKERIELQKEMIKLKEEEIAKDTALKGLQGQGGVPSNFGNSQGTGGPFVRTDQSGKMVQPGDLNFGRAALDTWEKIASDQDAAAKKLVATAAQKEAAVKKVVDALRLEGENYARTAEDQELYNRLLQAGVDLDSVAGKQIEEEVRAMQDRKRMADFWKGTQEADQASYEARKAVLESIATPTQKYNEEMDRLNRLLNAGTIAYGEWAAAAVLAHDSMVAGNKALEKTSTEMKFVEEVGTRAFERIGSGITDAFLNGESAAVNFKNVSMAVISELLQSFIQLAAVNPLKNLLFGTAEATLNSVGGSLATRLAGSQTGAANFAHLNGPNPPRASGGPVSAGQSYLVGERTAEIFTPNVNGRILPRVPETPMLAGPRQAQGDNFQLVQHLNFATGIQSTVRAEVMNMMPTISNSARMGMMEFQARRGRSM